MDGDSIMNTFKHKGIELDLSDEVISNKFRQIIKDRDDYEIQEYELVNDYLYEDIDVIELGGGIGFISCTISNIISDDSVHIVVEPTGQLVPVLEKNKHLNGCRFMIINAAYSVLDDFTTLYQRKEAYENTTMVLNDENSIIINEKEVEIVNLKTLVDTCDTENFALVCDIEGEEKNLITHEMDILEMYCNIIIVEIHDHVKEETLGMLDDSMFTFQEKHDNVYVYS